ncbi:unnamed protein product [Oikopleura dioica]|uniref:Uncharacterized protein n=1 Tax=Oikopleura dioica TaxID=34765 RepID=E4XYR9_OIKDI|nr:unnamed protein product [Oikopleura dioica]
MAGTNLTTTAVLTRSGTTSNSSMKEFFKAVDVYVEDANRKMAPGMLAIDSDARVFCKRAALADFCRWGTLPTRRLVSLFELIPEYSFETYRVNELSNRTRYCLTHYGLGGELALVVYAYMVRKLLLANGLSYDAQVHDQQLGTAPIANGMPNHRAPFHVKRRETDPVDISEEQLERRAFIAFRCTTEDLAYTGSAGRAAYQFLLQTVGRVGIHLREVGDDAGLLGQVCEARLDPRVWARFSADSFLALAKYFYTSAAEHYYCGSDEMMFCTLQLVYWVYTQTRRRQDVVLFGAYPLLNRYIKQMEILRPLGQERSVWVGGINCPKPTKDVYAFNQHRRFIPVGILEVFFGTRLLYALNLRVPQYMTVGLLPTTPEHDFQYHNKPFHGDYVEGSPLAVMEAPERAIQTDAANRQFSRECGYVECTLTFYETFRENLNC